MPFGGLLGSSFNFVFETQLEALQNGDRFYYLSRTAGLNFGTELEQNSFAKLVMLNADVTHLPDAIFSTPAFTLEVNPSKQFTGEGEDGRADPSGGAISINGQNFVPLVIRDNPNTPGADSNYLQYTGEDHVVLGGTAGDDVIVSGDGDERSTAMAATTGSKAASATTSFWAAPAMTSSRTWRGRQPAGR